MSKETIINKLREEFSEQGLGSDVFDFEAEWDSELTDAENERILKEKIKPLLPRDDKEMVKQMKAQQERIEIEQKDSYTTWLNNNQLQVDKLYGLFSKPTIIGLISDPNNGKSNTLYYILKTLGREHQFKLFYYGLKVPMENGTEIFSIEELEKVRNSVIIIDEFFSLFDLEDRTNKKMIEKTLRLIYHNNNILILAGLPENFKKFISNKLHITIYGRCTVGDFINGSGAKSICLGYAGVELGSRTLMLPLGQFIVYDGEHYSKMLVPYLPEYDTKAKNVPILVDKKVNKKIFRKK